MKLYYSHNLNPRVAVAVARYLNAPVTFVRASPRQPDQEEAFRSINPNTLVPVLVEGEHRIWEADAIACRLSALMHSDVWPGASDLPELIMWLSWSAHHFTRAAGTYYFENLIRPRYFGQPPDQRALQEAEGNFHRYATVLNETLNGRDWLIGNRLSYADFRVASALPFASEARMPIENYQHIQSWYARLNLIDAWRDPFAGLE